MRNRASQRENRARFTKKKYIYIYACVCVYMYICIDLYVRMCVSFRIVLLTKRAVGLASGAPHVRIKKNHIALSPALPLRSTIDHSLTSRIRIRCTCFGCKVSLETTDRDISLAEKRNGRELQCVNMSFSENHTQRIFPAPCPVSYDLGTFLCDETCSNY